MRVGIEAISFDLPKFYIDMAELAQRRNVDPEKYSKGLGQIEMSVASPCEDAVTLAASAGLKLLRGYSVDPQSIALVIVGTETAIDHSKPIASHVHQILGLSTQCRVFEVKHACYGATAGLSMATDWILSGRAKGKKALIIATDIARYGANTPGEPTQGAGAVAMLVSDNPQLLELETKYQGFFAKQVMDFWRPTYSKEAIADGHFSIQCYLDALTQSYQMYKKSFEIDQGPTGELMDRFTNSLYHVPFVKMAMKAHQRIKEIEWGTTLEKENPEYSNFVQDFKEKVAEPLHLNSKVGNIYTGSLYLSLFSFLERANYHQAGKPISLFSYGSGSCAEFFSGVVQPNTKELMKNVSSQATMASRVKISIERYEEILQAASHADHNDANVSNPEKWDIDAPVVYVGTKSHQRHYVIN